MRVSWIGLLATLGLALPGFARADDSAGSLGFHSPDVADSDVAPLDAALDKVIAERASVPSTRSATLARLAADPEIAAGRVAAAQSAEAGRTAMKAFSVDAADAAFGKAAQAWTAAQGALVDRTALGALFLSRAKLAQLRHQPQAMKEEFERALELLPVKHLDPLEFSPDEVAVFQQALVAASSTPPSPAPRSVLADAAKRSGTTWVVYGEARHRGAGYALTVTISDPTGGAARSENVEIPPGGDPAAALRPAITWLFTAAHVPPPTGVAVQATPATTPSPTAVAVATPMRARPFRTPVAAPSVDEGWTPSVSGALDTTQFRQSASGANGGALSFSFVGSGPQVAVAAARRSVVVGLAASYLDYEGSSANVKLPDGTHSTVNGGTTLAIQGGGAWRYFFGGDREVSPQVRAGGALFYESHSAQDVHNDVGGTPLGLFASYSVAGIKAQLGGRLPLLPSYWLRPALVAGFDVTPLSIFSQSPSGTYGSSPSAGVGLGWRAGVSLSTHSPLEVALLYEGETRSVSFSGPGRAPVAPALANVKIQDNLTTFQLGVRWVFGGPGGNSLR